MGADMILAWVEVPKEPNFDAMTALIASLDDATLDGLGDEGFRYESGEGRAFWTEQLRQFRELVEAAGSRESFITEIGGGRPVLITGGLSWGDSPTDDASLIDTLWEWPELLWAGGFGHSYCSGCDAEIWPAGKDVWVDGVPRVVCGLDVHRPQGGPLHSPEGDPA